MRASKAIFLACSICTFTFAPIIAWAEDGNLPAITVPKAQLSDVPQADRGAMRRLVQLVWDSQKGQLDRRETIVFDPFAQRDLDLTWEPRNVNEFADGPAQGEGILTWRLPDMPAFLTSSVVAQYRGMMADGKPHGTGTFATAKGARYDGDWEHGLMQGQGAFRTVAGDTYKGGFHRGLFDGKGLFISAAGEVYDGAFFQGQRHGAGTFQTPSGSRFASIWLSGVEQSGARKAVPHAWSQLHQVQSVPPPIGLAVPISVGGPAQFCCGMAPSTLRYTSVSLPDRIEIFPDLPELLDVWRGKRNIVIDSPRRFDWDRAGFDSYTFLNLTELQNAFELPLQFGLENRLGQGVTIIGGYLEITRSRIDRQPAMQALILKPLSSQNIEFSIENFGWSSATNVALEFRFINLQANIAGPYQRIDIGQVDGVDQFTFASALSEYGVNVERLRATGGRCGDPYSDDDSCVGQLTLDGVFGQLGDLLHENKESGFIRELGLVASGELVYDWTDSDQQIRNTRAPFEGFVPLMTFSSVAECEGAMLRDVDEGRVFELEEQQVNYRIPIPIEADLPAGQNVLWEMMLSTGKSTIHNMRVVLLLADGREISSRDIQIEYLRPRTFPANVRPFEPRC